MNKVVSSEVPNTNNGTRSEPPSKSVNTNHRTPRVEDTAEVLPGNVLPKGYSIVPKVGMVVAI